VRRGAWVLRRFAPAAGHAAMTSHESLVDRLVARGLLDAEAVVDGEVRVLDASRRHRNARVHAGPHASYVAKRGREAGDGAGTVAYEAAVYDVLSDLDGPRIPRSFGCDPATGILVIELLPEAENVRQRAMRTRQVEPALAAAIGDALGRLHAAGAPRDARLSRAVPDVVSLAHPTLGILHNASPATAGLMRTVQATPELAAGLDALAEKWRPLVLIHGDPRWENWLVESADEARVALVDWEFAGVGDPAWDVASAVCEYLTFWVRSAPAIPGTTIDQAVVHSDVSLDDAQTAIRALWLAYARRRLPPDLDAEVTVVTRHTAARLVQLAAEQTHFASEVTAPAGALLQLAANVFADPARAARELLGVPALAPVAA
jgi:hypothetical protein